MSTVSTHAHPEAGDRYRFSQAEQSARFFRRPHTSVARTPITSPAAWKRADLDRDPGWCEVLDEPTRQEIVDAVARLRGSGAALADVTPDDFVLPGLEPRLDAWRAAVRDGRGFQVVRGLPVEHWTLVDAEWFFWCLGLRLGTPGEQNPKGDLLGHVTDTGAARDDPFVRAYETNRNILYHCDGADAVGLLCWQTARSGGASRLASSVAIYNEILRREPALVDALYEPFPLDLRNDANPDRRWTPMHPCRHDAGVLRTFYHGDYYRSGQRHADAPRLTEAQQRVLDLYETIGNDPAWFVDMQLERGDFQLVSNHTVVHARTEYEDHDEPERRRRLLRLWLTW